jgi:NADH dehydrogenase FAD-containing subunit
LNHKSLSEFTLRKLRQNGIDVRLKTSAQKADSVAVHLTSGERIETGMIVCTVGTETHPLIKGLGLPLEKGRLKTDPDMKVTGTTNLWSLGDCSLVPNAYDGRPCPATAQFAMQQARQLAENLDSSRWAPRRSHSIFIREGCSPPSAIATPWRSFMESSYPASSPGSYGGESIC